MQSRFCRAAKDRMYGPGLEENLALIQTIFGENSRAISTLTQLLQTPYFGWLYFRTPVTPALLRLDPLWDPLRADPAFQKLCEEKRDKSIAVLPFENLSRDADNAYFAEGIQEEILTRLAKIARLKSDFAHFHAALSEQTSRSRRDREAAWCSDHFGRQRAKSSRPGAGQCAVD